jgi:tRNA(fMet)-specific endonuclease VapC
LSLHRDEIATGTPVWHELLFGLQRLAPSNRRQEIERYFDQSIRQVMPILAYDLAAAEWHALERARLVGIGRTPPYLDGQIAAIAAVSDLTLVTFNVADFQHFAGLRVEDWRL